MAKRLTENISSAYFEAANRLKPKKERRRIVAYVESYDDILFWSTTLNTIQNDKVYFEVMLPDRMNRLERGKKAAIMKMLTENVGHDMIACVDADYDYLLQGCTATSRQLLSSDYIFHTYAYSIENLFCYSGMLSNVCVAVTLNDRRVFDIEEYIQKFSEAIHPLFVWNIWHYRNNCYKDFTMTDFLRVIETGNFKLGNTGEQLHRLRQKVNRKIAELEKKYPEAKPEVKALRKELQTLGVQPYNCYLYIQGHHLMNRVVLPMLKKVCDHLIRMRQNEIIHNSVHSTQRSNELKCYNSRIEDLERALYRNFGFLVSEQYRQICSDINEMLHTGSQT